MSSIENDDDDFLALPQEDAPRNSLKRLKKKADKKSEVPTSPRKADLVSVLDINPSTDPSFRSTQELIPSVDLECHSQPVRSQSAELPWNLCAKSGDDNPLLESNFEMEPIKFSEEAPSDAEQEDHTGVDPDEDQDNDELDDCNAEDGSSSESEEEVDEDDEMAVLNLLEKRRMSSTHSEKAAPIVPPLQTPPVSLHAEEAAEKTRKNKKIKAAELEEMHAASQRLLRETPNASFKLQVSTGKSITSVLEKIRLRKMQLVQGWKSASIGHQSGDALEKIDQDFLSSNKVLPHAQNVLEVEDDGTQVKKGLEILQCNANKNAEGDMVSTLERHAEGDERQVSTPEKLAGERKSDDMEKPTYLGSGNVFRAPMEDTQDLLSPSQSSQEDGENLNLDTEEDNIFTGSRVNLHFDTETQDDYEQWQDEEANKENKEPALSDRLFNVPIAKCPSVRALIDDEAEDEDEDILVPGEEDEGDDCEDLHDMVIEETNEKEQDQEKRAELHRKWLEQQDAVMTDDILLRLKTGWRPRENRKRGLNCLDDDMELFAQKDRNTQDPDLEAEPQEFQEPLDENSQDVEASRDEANPDESRAFSFPEDLNDVHESDEEEAEQTMMRQRFLQESEEQGDLVSPADDETSREIFGLINKVNIASSNKKLKKGSVNDLRYLGGGASNSNSKSSFLRRSVSSTVGSVQRQGSNSGSGTRSFIFGRDDSNSSHSFDQHVDMREIKENLEPTSQGLRKETPHNKQYAQGKNSSKVTKPSSTRLGPSLFEILRCQSTNLDQSLQKKSFDEGSPILAAFKPIKSTNTPRVARRA